MVSGLGEQIAFREAQNKKEGGLWWMCYVFIPHNDIFLLPERAERACLGGVPFSTPVGKKNVLTFIKNDNHKQ